MNLPSGGEMLALLAILAIGSGIGRLSAKGISLGAAGVLFVALAFGHFGVRIAREITDLGLLLFVYSVGLQAGPRFFRAFRQRGKQFIVIGVGTATVGAVATVVVARLFDLPYALAAGMFTGALTCTPALAAAIDAVERFVGPTGAVSVSVGYGMAYPLSMLGVVVLIQFLPRLMRREVREEEARWRDEQAAEWPELEARRFLITNPNCQDKRVNEINPHRMSLVNISRVRRGDTVYPVTPETTLRPGDVVTVVGPAGELDKMRLLLGEEETQAPAEAGTDVLSLDIEASEGALVGKPLAALRVWQEHGVVITRIRRQGIELTPTGRASLEPGDTVRVVGGRGAVEAFAQRLGDSSHRDETNMLPFLAGLALGVLLGTLPLPIPGGQSVQLGIAGGAFLVSLMIGHFGRLGPLRLHVPPAAKNLSRDLGLMLFLAGVGTKAGSQFATVFAEQGGSLVLAGAIVTFTTILTGLFLMHRVFRLNLLATMGGLCACMTNPPGLDAANSKTETDLPMLSYASVYPVALIFKILLAQVLVETLRLWP